MSEHATYLTIEQIVANHNTSARLVNELIQKKILHSIPVGGRVLVDASAYRSWHINNLTRVKEARQQDEANGVIAPAAKPASVVEASVEAEAEAEAEADTAPTPVADPDEIVVTRAQAAEYLGLKEGTVQEAVRQGRLPRPITMGALKRFRAQRLGTDRCGVRALNAVAAMVCVHEKTLANYIKRRLIPPVPPDGYTDEQIEQIREVIRSWKAKGDRGNDQIASASAASAELVAPIAGKNLQEDAAVGDKPQKPAMQTGLDVGPEASMIQRNEVTAAWAAEQLGVTVAAIWKMQQRGKLPRPLTRAAIEEKLAQRHAQEEKQRSCPLGMTIREAAKQLGISRQVAYYHIRTGRLPQPPITQEALAEFRRWRETEMNEQKHLAAVEGGRKGGLAKSARRDWGSMIGPTQAAKMLGIAKSHYYNLVHDGVFKAAPYTPPQIDEMRRVIETRRAARKITVGGEGFTQEVKPVQPASQLPPSSLDPNAGAALVSPVQIEAALRLNLIVQGGGPMARAACQHLNEIVDLWARCAAIGSRGAEAAVAALAAVAKGEIRKEMALND